MAYSRRLRMEMKEIETHDFYHKDEKYEIKVFRVGNTFTVKAYLDNKEANYCSISISMSTITDDQWNWYHEKEPCMHLIDIVKNDIINNYGKKIF
jgi:hypothetical protein